ncbi:MAG: Crp/Fnr family transcriptional regulator [Nitrospira sp.]
MRVRDVGKTHNSAICDTCPSLDYCLTPSLFDRLQAEPSIDLRISTYPRSAWIFRQHEPQVGIHVVCDGSVVISMERADQRETVLRIDRRDRITNLEDWVLARPTYSISARALTKSTIIFIGKDDLRRLFTTDPAIAQIMTFHLARRMESVQRRHLELATTGVKSRLTTAFSELLEATGQETTQTARFEFPITRQLLADIVGAAPESISRALSELNAEALIAREPSCIIIPDVPRFISHAGTAAETPIPDPPVKAKEQAPAHMHQTQPRRHR